MGSYGRNCNKELYPWALFDALDTRTPAKSQDADCLILKIHSALSLRWARCPPSP